MRALVTGGAGYVGSHMVKALLDGGHEVVVIDDFSTGYRDAISKGAKLVEGDIVDSALVARTIRENGVEAVLHFAAKIAVGESVEKPRLYWRGNISATLGLLDGVLDAAENGKPVPFVFSSTAAVYGTPDAVPIDEEHPKRPVSPYGDTKLAIERVLEAYGIAYSLPWTALRYFNAAGAHPDAGLGERHEPETHLIPIVLQAAIGERPSVAVFGTEWPTPDGTCVRDYVHVRDLADAHLAALEHLRRGGASGAFNLGTGKGYSVREVIDAARRVTGRPITIVQAPVRAGDPAELVAKVDRAREVLGWHAKRTDLDILVGEAWKFMLAAKQG